MISTYQEGHKAQYTFGQEPMLSLQKAMKAESIVSKLTKVEHCFRAARVES